MRPMDLAPVMPGDLAVARREGEGIDDRPDLRQVQFLRREQVTRRTNGTWRQERIVGFRADGLSTKVDELPDDGDAMRPHRLGSSRQAVEDMIAVVLEQLAPTPGRVRRDDRSARDHHARLAACASFIVRDVTRRQRTLSQHTCAVRQHDDPVAQRDLADRQFGEQARK
jgi:hypothetical protein